MLVGMQHAQSAAPYIAGCNPCEPLSMHHKGTVMQLQPAALTSPAHNAKAAACILGVL